MITSYMYSINSICSKKLILSYAAKKIISVSHMYIKWNLAILLSDNNLFDEFEVSCRSAEIGTESGDL